MSESSLWTQWWASPWSQAHPDWLDGGLTGCPPEHVQAMTRSQHVRASRLFAIEPCLPCHPVTALLHLALAQSSQQALILALVENTCCPSRPTGLNAAQQLECQRLAKALRAHTWLDQNDDPLQLLRAWVEPPVWQRLRLRFACSRVMQLERNPVRSINPAKLQVLWQAVIWRTNAAHPDGSAPTHHTEAHDHADATQN